MLAVFAIAFIARLSQMSHGMDQWDVVLYRNSLVDLRFYREAQWPLLLVFQKLLWTLLPGYSAQQILSLTNVILSAGTLSLFFGLVYRVTKSYLVGFILCVSLFFLPLLGVYSVVGMQDMAQTFMVTLCLATLLQFCYSQRLNWLYASGLVAGLTMGVRLNLGIILLPLGLAVLMTKGLKLQNYLRLGAAFVAGALVWLVAGLFIKPMPNAQPIGFFLSQFRMFNPSVLGYWTKAGSYALLSGEKLGLFYWLPFVWFVVYLLSHRRKKERSIGQIVALVGALVSLSVAYGLLQFLKIVIHDRYYLALIVLSVCLGYELFRFLPRIRSYLKNISHQEKALIVLSSLVLVFIVFDYSFTAPVARYLLPLVPAVLLLMLMVVEQKGWRKWIVVGLITGFSYWACSFGWSRHIVSAYHQLDPRSAVAEYVATHPGIYHDLDPNHSTGSHLDVYGVRNQVLLTEVDCGTLNIGPDLVIYYGDYSDYMRPNCPGYKLIKRARFQRDEFIIEDSLGNRGYTIYQLVPAQ